MRSNSLEDNDEEFKVEVGSYSPNFFHQGKSESMHSPCGSLSENKRIGGVDRRSSFTYDKTNSELFNLTIES